MSFEFIQIRGRDGDGGSRNSFCPIQTLGAFFSGTTVDPSSLISELVMWRTPVDVSAKEKCKLEKYLIKISGNALETFLMLQLKA